jgi:predicted Zn-dependent peptidase
MQPKPPPIFPVRQIELPPVKQGSLSNGLPFYQINQGTQELVRIELVFWAGRPYEKHPLVARTASSLLKESTLYHTGAAIAEKFDYYGAGLSTPFQMDTANVVMYALNKQLPQVLPLFIEVLNSPAYLPKELAAYVNRRQQSLKEDLSKSEVLAYRHITECYFGSQHPYGYNSSPDQYDQLRTSWLKEHHDRCYNAQNGFALISGHFDSTTEKLIHQALAQLRQGQAQQPHHLEPSQQSPQLIRLAARNTSQAAIRMGRRLFPRQHPDADGMYIVAHLLGGYFGSRLMENIREDKGYTYNISAAYDSLRFDGTLQIETEVSPEFVEPCLREITHEIQRLQQELVPAEELEMLKNYLMGAFLTMIDGPFNWAETIRTLLVEQLDTSALNQLIQKVQNIQAEEIRSLAQQYLRPEDLWTVIAESSAEL